MKLINPIHSSPLTAATCDDTEGQNRWHKGKCIGTSKLYQKIKHLRLIVRIFCGTHSSWHHKTMTVNTLTQTRYERDVWLDLIYQVHSDISVPWDRQEMVSHRGVWWLWPHHPVNLMMGFGFSLWSSPLTLKAILWQPQHAPLTSITRTSHQVTGSLTSPFQNGPIFGGISTVGTGKEGAGLSQMDHCYWCG